ncbi:MAG TPA: hypothetical protein VGN34_19445 [Ktedonobacteraceae bacterium]
MEWRESGNTMSGQNRLPSLITEAETTLLRTELFRRAASGYEQIGSWREAAECWAEQGASDRAGALYARGGDLGHAARSWLQAGRYREALQAYREWEQWTLQKSHHSPNRKRRSSNAPLRSHDNDVA